MNLIENLNKVFDSRIRLGIMSALVVNAQLNFNELKELLNITDGNLASHLKTLEESRYIRSRKAIVGLRPKTTYSLTPTGRKALAGYVQAMRAVVSALEEPLE